MNKNSPARYLFAVIIALASCAQPDIKQDKRSAARSSVQMAIAAEESVTLTNKNVKFLWRENLYDEELKDTFNTIVINEELCKTLTDAEKATLGYVATFIGNECSWDGETTEDRSNLKCKILTALNLGYQCSPKHLGFLRKWFKHDKKVLAELEDGNCPTTPDGSTIQDTFDEISIAVTGNKIIVFFKASGINLREERSWSWTETDHFEFDKDQIRFIKKDKSKVNRSNQ